jgi:aspartate carbamoyltransferase catalytic subunit
MAYLYFQAPLKFTRRIPLNSARRTRRDFPRHLLSTRTMTREDLDEYCKAAAAFEARRTIDRAASGRTIALLFFQPSTRTRIGFEVATVALGSHAIGIEDMSASRSNRRSGETLEDCASVISRLCDAIVVRHHEGGAAERMAAKSWRPVINAGDGWNEHPTQALIDIFALRRGLGSLRGSTIALAGDPRGRTVRSLVNLLRLEAPQMILFCPPGHIPVPNDVLFALAEYQVPCRIIGDIEEALSQSDAIMMAPFDMSDIGELAGSDYVSPSLTPDSHRITAEKLDRTGSKALIFHPLPRHDEIDPGCDELPNAMYFDQVRLSKFMRMAVLDRILASP